MARRRLSRRRSSSGTTKAKGPGTRNDGVSFKSKGQTDFTSNKQTVVENGNAGDRKENCDPQANIASPLHRPNHMNSLINVNSGRDSACSDDAPISSCSLYTCSSSTPSCDTPSLSSYDNSRTGTPSMRTPSIRTPSMRTPSLFGSSFDNSSFDASSLDFESNSSSLCGTPVTPRRGHPLDLSSSQEESSEESRARKRTEKRKRYRRNKRLRMLAAIHLENLEKEKLSKMSSSVIQDDEAVATAEVTIEVPSINGVVCSAERTEKEVDVTDEVKPTPALTTLKERDNVEEVVDEGFSENFDKAQRKNLEETIVTTSTSTTEALINGNNKELAVDVISIEVEGEVRYQEDCDNGNAVISKYSDGLSQTLKDEMDKITSDVLEKHLKENSSEVELQEIGVKSCSEEEKDSVSEEDSGQEQGTDDPPKDTDSEESPGSSSGVVTEEEIVTPVNIETASTSQSLPSGQPETEVGKLEQNHEEIKSENLPSDEQVNEEIDTIVCTKALSDEMTSAVVNDNLHLINRYDKLELVDVIETKGCPENLVVLEMKDNRESSASESDDRLAQEKEQKKENDSDILIGKVTFAEEENEKGDKVIDIPIIMETGYEEIFPEERVEVVDVMKAEEGEDDDIVIYEVHNDEETNDNEEEEENDVGTKEGIESEINDKVVNGEETTDSGNDSEPKEEVEITLNAGQEAVVSNDMNKKVEPVDRDEAKKPAGKVDAALAELDSIPDGVCESGEVEEEEEDEEEWSYYRMEPQTHPQSEDVITSGAPAAVPSKPAEDIEIIPEPVDMVHDKESVPAEEPKIKTEDILVDHLEESTDLTSRSENHEIVENVNEATIIVGKTPDFLESNMDMIPSLDDHPERLINFSGPGLEKMDLVDTGLEQNSPNGSGSPRAPGSPRSVEGFVTSVELNTADESFATNFAVNQAQDGFTGPVMDQTSGPFSVYVSSSPEPASLDPPALSSVDLLNMSASMTNGQMDDEHSMNATEIREESPVEIVHAQSTVEVVAPPSPVDKSGLETQFIMPDQQVPDSPVSAHMPPTDISFVPQPILEPSAEVPVPVYVDDTPVSEPELIPGVTQDTFDIEGMNTVSKTEIAENLTETLVSKVESFVETTQTEAHSFMETETSSQMLAEFETKDELLQLNSSPVPALSQAENVSSAKPLDFEMVPHTGEMEEATAPVNIETVDVPNALSPEPVLAKSPEPVLAKSPEPVEVKSPEPVLAKSPEPVLAKSPEPVEVKSPEPVLAKSPEPVEVKSPEPVEVKSPEPVEVKSPEPVEVKSPEPIKSPEPVVAKSPEQVVAKTPKAAKTPAKSTGEKAATKATPGKATPGKSTPAKATPKSTPTSARTPSTRTPTTKTPLTKPTEKKTPTSKPASPAVASRTTTRPTSARPTSATTTTKPTVPRTAAPKQTTKTAPTKPSTTKSSLTASKPTTKAAGTTAPRAGSTTRPSTTRPTSASTTATTTAARRPLGATRAADKTDGKLVNGTARPSSRPGTAKPTGTTTATRKPLTSTAATKTASKPAAEKETKNTTNKILSTRPTKTSTTTTKLAATKASATHSTTRTTSKVSDSANATKSRVATSTKTSASKTTGAATKKTLVSKSKTSQAGTKETSIKTKTEAEVITQAEPLVNGENKIADEETSVEVLEKSAVEDIMQASSEKIITETMSSEQMVVTTETTEVLVNGDH